MRYQIVNIIVYDIFLYTLRHRCVGLAGLKLRHVIIVRHGERKVPNVLLRIFQACGEVGSPLAAS